MGEFTHFDDSGASRMVDITHKEVTRRHARATGRILMNPTTLQMIVDRKASKGDVREVARLAGIMAAKRTSEIIPLCHSLPLTSVKIDIAPHGDSELFVAVDCQVDAKTGVEMEALTAVATVCLTVYDMCKGVDREMRITDIQLDEKSGGQSGHFIRTSAQ